MFETELILPRSAFSPRERARAGDVWRAFQDLAVGDSIAAGWPPERYRDEGVSFVVRSMRAVHHRETRYGERLVGRSWPSRFRRGMLFRRECRLAGPDGAPLASATQGWVHVGADLSPARASEALVAAFRPDEREPPIELPPHEPLSGGVEHTFELECWHTWMDPLGHVNHPAYVDWADEATSRAMIARGLDPVDLRPVAESARYRSGVRATERVTISTRVTGRTEGGAAVLRHDVSVGEREAARVVTVRRLAGERGDRSRLELCYR